MEEIREHRTPPGIARDLRQTLMSRNVRDAPQLSRDELDRFRRALDSAFATPTRVTRGLARAGIQCEISTNAGSLGLVLADGRPAVGRVPDRPDVRLRF